MEKQIRRQRSSRFFAFAAIVVSTVSVTGCLLSFPLIFHYLQSLEASVQSDLDFCNIRSRDMWNAIVDIHGNHGNSGRMARAAVVRQELKHRRKTNSGLPRRSHANKNHHDDAGVRFWVQRVAKDDKPVDSNATKPKSDSGTMTAVSPFIQCCTCHRGLPGPPGPPGPDGRTGALGPRGQAGARGDPSPSDPHVMDKNLKQCPCEIVPGNKGQAGPRGPDGPFGDKGPSGVDGKPGEQGQRGPGGFPGRTAQDGPQGPPGDAGKQKTKVGPAGERGLPGKAGNAGPQGPPGVEGKDGKRGEIGPAGWPGVPGLSGRPGKHGPEGGIGKLGSAGSCTHCSPARLAPGY